jgi:hypothetical protein
MAQDERPAERLVKVRVDLAAGARPGPPPTEGGPAAESLWAEPLGGDLYRLRNVPALAFDLHFHDVVRAVAARPGELPTIVARVSPSGHRTLRVLFAEQATDEDVRRVLRDLNEARAFYEHAVGRLYAVDVEPEGDYSAVCAYLRGLEQRGVLSYETGATSPAAG